MIKLLDCTLRDGGYYPNWDFDKELIKNYFQNIDKLPIEYIEIGYRSILKNEYLGEYFYLPLSTLKNIRKYTNKKLAIMLNSKDCYDVDLSQLLLDTKPYISLIRIATDPNKIEFSIKLAKEIKSLGYEVAINLMYISKVNSNHKIFDYLESIEEYIDTLNLVDSYGSIYPNELATLINQVKTKSNITLGFHGHNNMELAFANTLIAIENGVEFIDSTILGMGRGAGNLKTELLLTYLKSNKNLDVDLNIVAKITEIFQPLLDKYKWGTNLAYMVSGSYSLPQKDVMEALEINRYSLSGIINHIRKNNEISLPKFKSNNKKDNCLIVGGGDSIFNHIVAIKEYLSLNKNIILIHSTSKYIELFEDIKNMQLFCVSGDELLKVDGTIQSVSKYILEPTPRKINAKIENKDNFYELEEIDFIDSYHDSPLAISLQTALELNASNIYIVGFDGYSEMKSKKELYLMQENQTIINSIKPKIELISLTPTKYQNIKCSSIYGMIC